MNTGNNGDILATDAQQREVLICQLTEAQKHSIALERQKPVIERMVKGAQEALRIARDNQFDNMDQRARIAARIATLTQLLAALPE